MIHDRDEVDKLKESCKIAQPYESGDKAIEALLQMQSFFKQAVEENNKKLQGGY